MVNKIDLFPFYIEMCAHRGDIEYGYTQLCNELVESQLQALDSQLGVHEYTGGGLYTKRFSYYEADGVVLSESSLKVSFYSLGKIAVGFDQISYRGPLLGEFTFRAVTEELVQVIEDRKRKIAEDEIDRIDREDAKRIKEERIRKMTITLFGE